MYGQVWGYAGYADSAAATSTNETKLSNHETPADDLTLRSGRPSFKGSEGSAARNELAQGRQQQLGAGDAFGQIHSIRLTVPSCSSQYPGITGTRAARVATRN